MFSSAELIEALTRRGRARLWFRAEDDRPPGEFPAGWKAWFASMTGRIGAVTGASADAIVTIFLQRELAARPRRVGALNRWQSFATLWRQQWQPPEREDRRVRMIAYAITLLVHLLLSVILLWLAYVRFTGAPPAPQGDAVVQVEYIGEGTPEEQGGGPPAGAAPAATDAAAAPTASDSTAAPAQATPVPPRPVTAAQPSAPVPPQEPAPPAAQPLQVTQVPTPDTEFTLPPPTVRSVELPQPVIAVPELQVPSREIEIVEAPTPVRPIQPALPQPQITVPRLERPAPDIVVREVPPPLPQVQSRTLPQRALTTPELRIPAPRVGVREIPMPTPATIPGTAAASPASGAAPATAAASGPTPTGRAPTPGGAPSARSGTQATAPAAGSGPAATPKPGALPTPQRGDDWGASSRNRPGGNTGRSPGLFNADGSPRLPPGTAAPGGGSPPGAVEERIADLDRAGTWLKRPPIDYTPTRFDKFWRPHETLLQEWVRKGIKTVTIPIPGTSKKLLCGVSLLQLGGGCSISDPNINDQEATARPPPDIPFKPELQEDQDSLRRPAGNP